jgi:hypothetical protein
MLSFRGCFFVSRPDEKDLFFPMDNVYLMRDFCHPRFVLCEAIEELRAHCEPPLLDRIDEFIHAKIEFNMKAGKAVGGWVCSMSKSSLSHMRNLAVV